MRTVDAVLFDKTGTLTKGAHTRHRRRRRATARSNDDVLRLAAAVEADSEHPLAKAIVTAAQADGLTARPRPDFQSLTGRGVRATIDGVRTTPSAVPRCCAS